MTPPGVPLASINELHAASAPSAHGGRGWGLQPELPPGGLVRLHLDALVVLQLSWAALKLLVGGVVLLGADEHPKGLVLLLDLHQAPGVGRPDDGVLLAALHGGLEGGLHAGEVLSLV